MKKLIYTAFVICGMLTASCSDLLNLESKTDVTNNYLFTTPEGLNTAVTGLYSLARELPGGADNNESNLDIVSLFRPLPESIKLQVVSIRPIRVDMVGDVFIRIPIY